MSSPISLESERVPIIAAPAAYWESQGGMLDFSAKRERDEDGEAEDVDVRPPKFSRTMGGDR